jgi:hypothetical protein
MTKDEAPVQEPDLIARLKHPEQHYEFTDPKKANAVLMSLCQEAADALAAPVQEPVWIQPDHLQKAQKAPFLCRVEPNKRDDFVPLYTTPPAQRQWVGLTDEDVDEAARYCVKSGQSVNAAIRAIEAKLKEKNT